MLKDKVYACSHTTNPLTEDEVGWYLLPSISPAQNRRAITKPLLRGTRAC